MLLFLCTIKTVAQADCECYVGVGSNPYISDYDYYGYSGGRRVFSSDNTITVKDLTEGNSRFLSANSIVLGQGFMGYAVNYDDYEIKAAIQDCSVCSCIQYFSLAILSDPYFDNYKRYEIFNTDPDPECDINKVTFDWYYNDKIIEDGGIWLTLPWSDVPSIKLVAKLANGCTNTFYFKEDDEKYPPDYFGIVTQAAIDNSLLTNTEQVTVHPNPSTGIFTVSGNFKKNMPIIVTNQYNVQVLKSVAKTDNQEQIDLTGFPNGIYIVKFLGTNTIYTGKLIKG